LQVGNPIGADQGVTNLAVQNPVVAINATHLSVHALNEVRAMLAATPRGTRRHRSSSAAVAPSGAATLQECDGGEKFFDTGWFNV
jgi:hypothetical protein